MRPQEDDTRPKTDSGNQLALPEGHVLANGQYVIERELGSGGFGITYVVRHGYIEGMRVAIKEFLPAGAAIRDAGSRVSLISDRSQSLYSWGLDRFLDEARLLHHFSHPNIVRVQNFFKENNTAYMVMDYVEGVSVEQRIRDGHRFSEEELLSVALPLLDALGVLHAEQLYHRDITPANILIQADGSPVLIDFGSARYAMRQCDGDGRLTSIYTPGYAPIEQYEQTPHGPYTDIYGLAATLYTAAFHKTPVDALRRSGAVRSGAEDPLVLAREQPAEGFSAAFRDALDAGLRLGAEDRPQSVDAWAELFGATPSAERTRILRPPARQAALPAAAARGPRRRPLLAVAGGLLAAALGVAGWWLTGPGPPPEGSGNRLAEAVTLLAQHPLDPQRVTAAQQLYGRVLESGEDSVEARLGQAASAALEAFTAAVADDRLADARSQLEAARPELTRLGIADQVLPVLSARLQSAARLAQAHRLLRQQPLDPAVWNETGAQVQSIRDDAWTAPRKAAVAEAIAALRRTGAALGNRDFAAAEAGIRRAESSLEMLGGGRLAAARERVGAERQRHRQAERAAADEAVAAGIQALGSAPLTPASLAEARSLFQEAAARDAEVPEAARGLGYVDAGETVLERLEAAQFDAARGALEELRRHGEALGLTPEPADALGQRLAEAEAAWQEEQRRQRRDELLARARERVAAAGWQEAALAEAEMFYQQALETEAESAAALAGLEVVILLRAARSQTGEGAFAEARATLEEARGQLDEAGLPAEALAAVAGAVDRAEVERRLQQAVTALDGNLAAEQALAEAEDGFRRVLELEPEHSRAAAGVEAVAALRAFREARAQREFDAAREQLRAAGDQLATVGAGGVEPLLADLERRARRWEAVSTQRAINRALAQAIEGLREAPLVAQRWAAVEQSLADIAAVDAADPRLAPLQAILEALRQAGAAVDTERFADAAARVEEAETALEGLGIRTGFTGAREAVAEARAAWVRQTVERALAPLQADEVGDQALAQAQAELAEVAAADADAAAGAELLAAIGEARQAMAATRYAAVGAALDRAEERLASLPDGAPGQSTLAGLVERTAGALREARPAPAQVVPKIARAVARVRNEPLDEAALEQAEGLFRQVLALQADEPSALAGAAVVESLRSTRSALAAGALDTARARLGEAEQQLERMGISGGALAPAWRAVDEARGRDR